MRLFFSVALLQNPRRSQKAGPVRHTSTKFFLLWKSSRLEFFRDAHSSPEFIPVSSTALITAAQNVHKAREELETSRFFSQVNCDRDAMARLPHPSRALCERVGFLILQTKTDQAKIRAIESQLRHAEARARRQKLLPPNPAINLQPTHSPFVPKRSADLYF